MCIRDSNKTYEFITSMQEIKLQDCEQRRRWEWEDTQADLFLSLIHIYELTNEALSPSNPQKRISGKQRKATLEEYQQTFLQVPRIDDRKRCV